MKIYPFVAVQYLEFYAMTSQQIVFIQAFSGVDNDIKWDCDVHIDFPLANVFRRNFLMTTTNATQMEL